MREVIGANNRILEIDLTAKKFLESSVNTKDRDMYWGGKGLALKLLYDRLEPGVDPLGEKNIFIIETGVLTGTGAPCSGRFEVVSKSPLTGIINCSSCGGPFGMAVKTSGWDAIILTGRAASPVYLIIDYDGVQFKPADTLWGKDTAAAEAEIIKEGSGAMVIGPAGENLVRFANIRSGHRFVGRGGMGAVLGAKNIKGIVAKGKEIKIVPANKKLFFATNKKFLKYINRNFVTSGTYRQFGTNSATIACNTAGTIPVRNFTCGSHGEVHKISGEAMAERFKTKWDTCRPCAILCGHKGTIDGKEIHVPEYETVHLLGSNLEIFDSVIISEWNELCSQYGMDTISVGGTLGWAMEATEKGLIKTNLKFGSPDSVAEMIENIALGRGIGKDLGQGSRLAAKKYGGEDFAMHVKGLELPGYEPRGAIGHGLGYATANRGGCHLSSYIIAIEVLYDMADPYNPRWKHYMVKFMEDFFAALNSMHICQFTAYAVMFEPPLIKMSPFPVIKILMQNSAPLAMNLMDVSLYSELWHAVLGKTYLPYLGMRKFLKMGERVHVLERHMNTREGISKKDDTLPLRLLTEGRKCDAVERTVPLEKMLKKYYKLRGFDSNGVPQRRTLKRLGIEIKE